MEAMLVGLNGPRSSLSSTLQPRSFRSNENENEKFIVKTTYMSYIYNMVPTSLYIRQQIAFSGKLNLYT